MNKTLALLLLLIFIPQLAIAQLRATTDDGRQVVLKPDKTWEFIAVETSPASPTAASPGVLTSRNWLYAKNVDPLTDKDSSMVVTPAKGRENSGLVIRCKGAQTEIYIPVATNLGPSPTSHSRVVYRFLGEENAPPVETLWSHSTDSLGVFIPPEQRAEFIKNIQKYKGLVVRVFDAAGTPHTLEFSLEDDDGFIGRLDCLK